MCAEAALWPSSTFVIRINFSLAGWLVAENKLWFQPTCTGSAEEGGRVGPSPRAFHVAVAIDCNIFIFGGRYGRKRFDPYPRCFVIPVPRFGRGCNLK